MVKPLEGHKARKRFGQNFLVDNYYIDQIIEQIHPQPDQHVVEIGPGLGAITKLLLPPISGQLTVVEIDNDLAERLQQNYSEQITIVHQDVLTVDFAQIYTGSPLKIVGNLPYNISTPLMFHLTQYLDKIEDVHVMLQKEMAQRLLAEPCSKHYGRLTVMMQYYFDIALGFHLPPSAFHPAPKVDSSFIEMRPILQPEVVCMDKPLFEKVVNQAFQQRRKTLRNTLRNLMKEEDFIALAIEPSLRPDNLSVQDYVNITNYLSEKNASV